MKIRDFYNREFTTKTLGINSIDEVLTKESHLAENSLFIYSSELAETIYITFDEFFAEIGEGFEIKSSRIDGSTSNVTGIFTGKPFEMQYDSDEASGTIEGDFTDEERLQILTAWEMQQ
jgi:hypothetical protein